MTQYKFPICVNLRMELRQTCLYWQNWSVDKGPQAFIGLLVAVLAKVVRCGQWCTLPVQSVVLVRAGALPSASCISLFLSALLMGIVGKGCALKTVGMWEAGSALQNAAPSWDPWGHNRDCSCSDYDVMWLGAVIVALMCVSYSPHLNPVCQLVVQHLSPVLKCTELQEIPLHKQCETFCI